MTVIFNNVDSFDPADLSIGRADSSDAKMRTAVQLRNCKTCTDTNVRIFV